MAINVVYRITVGLSPTLSMVTYTASVWINRVRLPILHVRGQLNRENELSLSAFTPENLGLARRFRQFRPASACSSSPYSG